MTTDETDRLLARLAQSEDPWVERKQSFDEREVRKTVVGFANSMGEGQTAVMFIGAHNKGQHKGVPDADDIQKKITGALERCYPQITYQTCVLTVKIEDKKLEIVAILIPFSQNRPHFTGPAYVRRGSETIPASQEVFLELIASQNDKARRILQFKEKRCWLRLESKSGFWIDLECVVELCDAHAVTLRDDEGRPWSFPLPSVTVNKTPTRDLEIIATQTATEEEFIREIIHRWARLRKPPALGEYHLESDWLVSQLLANPARVLPTVAALADSSDNLWLRRLQLHVRFALKKSEAPTPHHQKLRRLEALFHEAMLNQHEFSNQSNIGAAVGATIEVATSLTEAEEFLRILMNKKAGVAQVGYESLWNALLWALKL